MIVIAGDYTDKGLKTVVTKTMSFFNIYNVFVLEHQRPGHGILFEPTVCAIYYY